MRILKFLILALVAVSLVAVSRGLIETTLTTQTDVPYTNATMLEQPRMESDSVSDSSLSDSILATQSHLPISTDPYLERQWKLDQIRSVGLLQVTGWNPEIWVAVLDTGIDQKHEDLEGRVVSDVNFTSSPTPSDIYGHGTHVAGIIAANSNNSIGISGVVPECQLMNVKVADDKGKCQASTVATGIIWAVDNGASVINISVELEEHFPELEEAVNYAWSGGVVIVAAAGNSGSELPVYPAYYENCLAVAATKEDGTLAPLSNHGDWVDVAAPGFNIYSTLCQNGYGYKTGTSFATAHVSGLAALLFSVVSDSNDDGRLNDEVRAAIEAGFLQIGLNIMRQGSIDTESSSAEVYYTT